MGHDSHCVRVSVSRQAAAPALQKKPKGREWREPGLALSFKNVSFAYHELVACIMSHIVVMWNLAQVKKVITVDDDDAQPAVLWYAL